MEILHLAGIKKDTQFNYRRKQFNDYLISNKNYNVDTVYTFENNFEITKKYDLVIISTIKNISNILLQIPENTFILYDRSDNWSAAIINNKEPVIIENYLFKRANLITCSSINLVNQIPDEYKSKAYYISNGCNILPYIKEEKFAKKTAAIVGLRLYKFDLLFINNLANIFYDWNFNFYGFSSKDIDSYKENLKNKNFNFIDYMDENKLQNELCKCHLGLIPFIDGQLMECMFPLKIYNYANAHLPVLYRFCPSLKALEYSICTDAEEDYNINEIAEKTYDYDKFLNMNTWKSKFDKIMSLVKEKI